MPTRVVHHLAYGVRLAVSTDDARALARLGAHLPPGRVARPGPVDRAVSLMRAPGGFRVTRPGRRPVTLASRADALELVESDLQLFVAEHAPAHLFVHAGVVAWRGRAIVLPGRSGAGKSTLVAALVRAGARYYSDEYAAFDAEGRVHAYPRPLKLRTRGRPRRVAPPRARRPPLRVATILVCRYRPGARYRPRALSTAQTVLGLFKHTVAARSRTGFAFAVLAEVAARGKALYSLRGDARTLALELLHEATSAKRPPGP